jgi:hypothetical protein
MSWAQFSAMMILEETMEEKPVRSRSNGLAVASLCLGIVAIITSPGFMLIVASILERLDINLLDAGFIVGWYGSSDLFNFPSRQSSLLSPMLGMIGLILGIIGSKRTKKENWVAIAGMVICVLVILYWGLMMIPISFWALIIGH